jgi:hypothetical protein
MRNSTRAAALAVSALALGSLAVPAASAASTGTIRVCISGLEGRDAGVEVNRVGPGGRHIREADPCHTFSGLRSGSYYIDIDPPPGFHMGDDDRRIYLGGGEFQTLRLDVDRRDRHEGDRD